VQKFPGGEPMNLKPREREEPEIQMIPLVDVILLLLIFFMVSSTFSYEGRLRVQLPEASSAPASARAGDPIIVTVTAQGAYRVNERSLINNSPDTLRSALMNVAGRERSAPITIRADARATHQSVVTAMDVAGRLGFSQINIATVGEADGGGG
jgi:biopolymer transport protein ExbD